MINALENPGKDPTFLEYFGLKRPPFARLKKPSENFQTEQYSMLMGHLAGAAEHPDCLVMICGTDGSGKTALLNQFISGLDNDTSFVTVDERCSGEKDFYCALLQQLGFRDITGKARELRRIAKEFLVHRGIASDPVMMIVDNAHRMSSTVLEQLRWISATKVKDRRVLSIVLAGNSDLEKIIDSPAMSQIAFRSQVNFNIRAYGEEETAAYIKHRLKLAGSTNGTTFSDEAYALVCRYTGGTPNKINSLCNALLSKAYALASPVVGADLVRTVADLQKLVPHVVPHQGKGRRTTDPGYVPEPSEEETQEQRIAARDATVEKTVIKPAKKAARKSPARSAVPEIDGEDLLKQISLLSEALGEVKADKKRALLDLDIRDKEIGDLHKKLDGQSENAEKLNSTPGDGSEVARLNQALSDSRKALQHSQTSTKRLADDLEKERLAAKSALAEVSEARATVADLIKLKSELKVEISSLNASLEIADERVLAIEVIEKHTTGLRTEIAALAEEILSLKGEIVTRDRALRDVEWQLQESKSEYESLQSNSDLMKDLDPIEPEIDPRIEELTTELQSRELTIAELEIRIEESLHECESLRPLAAAHEKSDESMHENDEMIAELQSELTSYKEEIMALEARNDALELRDMELTHAENTSTLESELRDVRQRLADTQAELAAATKAAVQPVLEDQVPQRLSTSKPSYTGRPAFEVSRKGIVEEVIEIAEGQTRIMIGRGEDSDLRLKSGFVSRHHALIFCTEEGTFIEDLNSFNGTIVNSKKISRCAFGADDDVVIGDFRLRHAVANSNAKTKQLQR